MECILEVRDLHISYRSTKGLLTPALTGVNLCVQAGGVLGVLGESGSGKSTLAASLLRLLPGAGEILRGQIVFEGKDLREAGAEELRRIRGGRIALIFQEPNLALHPTIRVRDQVEEVLRAHEPLGAKQRLEKAQKVLESVFGADAARISASYPHQLSGGQRQRALIAQAIASGPSLLVADEPTAALDSTTQREILGVFARLRHDLGLAMILITHNPALLAGFADRVLVLYAGEVAELGPAREVLSRPKHPYTEALLRCLPQIEQARASGHRNLLRVVAGDAPDPAALPPGCRFEPRCPERMAVCITREPAATQLDGAYSVSCYKFGG